MASHGLSGAPFCNSLRSSGNLSCLSFLVLKYKFVFQLRNKFENGNISIRDIQGNQDKSSKHDSLDDSGLCLKKQE